MLIQSSELSFEYHPERSFNFPDLSLHPSESALLLGASGSGKSTFLSLLAGLQRPKHGQIKIKGQELTTLSDRDLEKFRAEHIGIIFQKAFFLPYLSITENLLLGAQLQKTSLSKKEVYEQLEALDIRHIAHQKPSSCSLGEQQRASIARVLLQKPALILADEPTSALDDQNAARVAELLHQASLAAESALLIVTHDQRLKSQISKSYQL